MIASALALVSINPCPCKSITIGGRIVIFILLGQYLAVSVFFSDDCGCSCAAVGCG